VKNHRELLGAGMASVVATGADLGLLVVLVAHHVTVGVATFVAALGGAAVSFALGKYVAFRDGAPLSVRQIVRFDVVAVVAALLVAVAVKVVAGGLGVPVVAAKLACAALVFAVWTYPAQKRFVFPRAAEVAS
jgi:putative flippase GtrA